MSEHTDLQQVEIPTRQQQVRILSERVDDLQRRLRDYGCYAEELDKIISKVPKAGPIKPVTAISWDELLSRWDAFYPQYDTRYEQYRQSRSAYQRRVETLPLPASLQKKLLKI